MSDKSISSQKAKAQFYAPSKKLKAKAGLINKSLIYSLEGADDFLDEKQGDYLDWAQADIKTLERAYSILTLAVKNNGEIEAAKDDVFRIAYSMKGQGGMFKYPLITLVMDNLCNFLSKKDTLNPQILHVIELHIGAVNQILNHRLMNKGGNMGEELVRGLIEIVKKID